MTTVDLIRKYAAPVPRYTSYPTAPHFSAEIGHGLYSDWLAAMPERSEVSLYAHIPFCRALCWYCGCTTKATRQSAPVSDYLRPLINEASHVTRHLPRSTTVRHMAWGGGSPNILPPEEILRLSAALRAYFHIAPDAEFAVEVDPRYHTRDHAKAFADAGVTRLSVGVQDFDQQVQAAINRIQSFAMTQATIADFRDLGVGSVNIDLVYGLPHQDRDSVMRTIEQVITLAPDRIALFGYAHLPQRIRHQRLIDDAALPDSVARFEQSERVSCRLVEAGYVRVGLDHFALPGDALAKGGTRRNFQGYTTDRCNAMIGLGASAIGRLPQGYVQNAVATPEYARRIRDNGLATARGHRLTEDDEMRAFVIERLMCDLCFSSDDLAIRFGSRAETVLRSAQQLLDADEDGLIEPSGHAGFVLTDRGRPFVRTIASYFDAYIEHGQTKYSTGV